MKKIVRNLRNAHVALRKTANEVIADTIRIDILSKAIRGKNVQA